MYRTNAYVAEPKKSTLLKKKKFELLSHKDYWFEFRLAVVCIFVVMLGTTSAAMLFWLLS